MASNLEPWSTHLLKRASMGLLLAGSAATGVTAPSAATGPGTAHPERPTAESPSNSTLFVHAATERAISEAATQPREVMTPAAAEITPTLPRHISAPYHVAPTDTLAGIAQSQLGDASRYPEIFELNKGKPQADGRSLTDPDLIQIGWVLELPSAAGAQRQPAPVPPTGRQHRPATAAHPATKGSPVTVPQAVGATQPSESPKDIARSIVPSDQFGCFDDIISRESSWDVHATNPSSGAYGLPQSLPASKMATAGPDWHDNAATQLKWALDYMNSRYGSPCDAWSFWQGHSWY